MRLILRDLNVSALLAPNATLQENILFQFDSANTAWHMTTSTPMWGGQERCVLGAGKRARHGKFLAIASLSFPPGSAGRS